VMLEDINGVSCRLGLSALETQNYVVMFSFASLIQGPPYTPIALLWRLACVVTRKNIVRGHFLP
jgi:hypothetical protein